jgi:hypothetical protein
MDATQIDAMNSLLIGVQLREELELYTRIGIVVSALMNSVEIGDRPLTLVLGHESVKLKLKQLVLASGKDFDELYKNLKKLSKNDSCNSCDSWQENGGKI